MACDMTSFVSTQGLDRAWNELAYLKSRLDLIDSSSLSAHESDQFRLLSHQTGVFALLVIELGANRLDLSGKQGADDLLIIIQTHCHEAVAAIDYWLQRAQGSLKTKVRVQ